MLNLESIIDLIRSLIYIWVALEAIFLFRLYQFAHENHKRSPIISTLQKLFLALGIMFLYYTFLPIIRMYDQSLHKLAVSGGAFFVVIVGFCLTRFRIESLSKQPKIHKQFDRRIKKE